MWTADGWRDYELLDASLGERLERWGSHILVRPDPQAIWKTKRVLPEWKTPEGRYMRSSTGAASRAPVNPTIPHIMSLLYRAKSSSP